MSSPILGIDLGTTNSVVAVADGSQVNALADVQGRRLIPSVVSFHPDGSILVGHDARDRRLVDATSTVFSTKRLIGRPFTSTEVKRAAERLPFALEPTPTGGVQVRVRRGTYTLPEISAFVLRHVREVAEQALGTSCSRAVITVPANFNELQRSATQAAAKIAGLEVVRMINEPTAATLAYGLGKQGAERVLVYDLGGGTFDVTVLDLDRDALQVVSTSGDTFLGGDDFDQLVADHLADACLREHRFDPRSDVQTYERLRAAAEWLKCQLSSLEAVDLSIDELFHEAGGRAVPFVHRMTRQDFAALVRPLVARTFDVVNEALRACGRRPREIDAVVLVGGSTRVPLVRDLVGEYFGRAPRFERDPDLVVAQGAALQAFQLAGRTEPARIVPRPMPPRAMPPRPREVLPRQPAFAPPERGAETAPRPSPATTLGRVALKRADDRPARSIDGMTDSPPTRAGVSLSTPVAILRPVMVGAPSPGAASPLTELDQVELSPTSLPAGAPGALSRRTRKGTMRGGTSALPESPSLAADSPFDLSKEHDLASIDEDLPTRVGKPPAPPPLPRAAAAPPPEPPRSEAAPVGPPPAPFSRPAPDAQDPATLGQWVSELPSAPTIPVPPSDLPLASLLPAMPAVAPLPPLDLAPHQPVIPMPAARLPLLMDVTPLSLGIETVSGYCQHLVQRNAPVPTEKTRVFATGRDEQTSVEIRICQGDSNRFAENESLGIVSLDALRRAKRGDVRIEVTFLIDASGVLDVRATDLDTQRVQLTRIQLRGGMQAAEVEAARARQERELAQRS
jgi:molecular chaperone DnaK